MKSNNRSIRVFLSSTFRDYGEERDLLVRKVFPSLRAKLKDRFVDLVDVDLRWGITVEQAENGEVLPICLAEIDRARPYFVGMLGERYGWIPEKDVYASDLLERQPWLRKHQGGKSVTELEILHGVLNNPKMANKAFFYFRSEAYAKKKGGDYIASSPEDRKYQKDLKAKIEKSKFPVVRYKDPESFAKRLEKDLWKILNVAFPADSIPDAFERESQRHEAYASPRKRLYLGGEKYLTRLDQLMQKGEPRILIEGASGGGKSALLANWLQLRALHHPKDLYFEHYLGASADAADPAFLVRRLLETIKRVTGNLEELPSDEHQLYESISKWLAIASSYATQKKTRWIIAIDSLNNLTRLRDLRWFPDFLPKNIQVIISTLPGEVMQALQAKGQWKDLKVNPLNVVERKNLLVTYLEKYNKTLSTDLLKQALAHPLSSNPLFLKTLAEELRLFGLHEELKIRLDHYLSSKTIDDLFERVLERVEGDFGEKIVRTAMTSIWASRAGLSESEILQMNQLVPATWAPIRNALDESLLESNGRILFAHDYMRIAVRDRYLPKEKLEVQAHTRLAQWFSSQSVDARRVEEEPFQWLEAKDWKKLRECLTNREIFEGFNKYRNPQDLIYYCLPLSENLGVDYGEILFKAWKKWRLPVNKKESGDVSAKLAEFFRYSSRYSFSEKVFKFAIDHQKKTYGPNHSVTLRTQSLFGVLLLNQSKFKQAIEVQSEVLRIRQHLPKKDPLKIAESMNFLGNCYYGNGRFEDAKALYLQVIPIRRNKLGLQNRDTLDAMNNLANVENELSHYEQAEKLHREVLQQRALLDGRISIGVAQSLNNLASVKDRQGLYKEAIELFRESISSYEAILGKDSPEILKPLSNMGLALSYEGKFEEASELQESALKISRRFLGNDHVETGRILVNLAYAVADLKIKKEYLLEAYEIFKKQLGDHQFTVGTLLQLSMIYEEEDLWDQSEKLLIEGFEMSKRLFGQKHKLTADTLQALGGHYYRVDENEKAKKYLLESLKIMDKILHKNHPHSINTLNYLAWIAGEEGDVPETFKRLKQVEESTKFNFGPDHGALVEVNEAYSRIHERLGDHKASMECALEALRLAALNQFDEEYIMRMHCNIGVSYRESGHLTDAQTHLEKAYTLSEKINGKDGESFSIESSALGKLRTMQGRYKEAEALLLQALKLRENAEEVDVEDVALIKSRLFELYQAMGNLKEAKKYHAI